MWWGPIQMQKVVVLLLLPLVGCAPPLLTLRIRSSFGPERSELAGHASIQLPLASRPTDVTLERESPLARSFSAPNRDEHDALGRALSRWQMEQIEEALRGLLSLWDEGDGPER